MANPRSPFLGKGRMHPCLSDFDYKLRYIIGAVCRRIVWSSILLGKSHQALRLSYFSWVNCPSLMSNCLLIILVIGSGATFGGFPSRFSKCCFHSFILSCWFVAFNLALTVLFLQLTSFIVCHAICCGSLTYLTIWTLLTVISTWDFAAREQINIGVIRTVQIFLPFLCNSIFLV